MAATVTAPPTPTDAPSAKPRRRTRNTLVAVAIGLVLAALGYTVGVRSPWTAHHTHTVTGTAERVAANVPIGYFDYGSGKHLSFRLDDVVWRADGQTGDGSIPPCLRKTGVAVAVHAELIQLARPFGSGSYEQVITVICPAP